MAVDFQSKTLSELRTMVENGERAGKTGHPTFLAAVAELDRRVAGADGRLSLERTREAIRAAALEDRCLSYGDVARASGIAWSMKTRSQMRDHLTELCARADRERLPLLSAVVVRAEDVREGVLCGEALQGFIALAVRLGFDADGTPEKQSRFVKAEQQKVFAWAKRESR